MRTNRIALVLIGVLISGPAFGQDASLANQARKILHTHCYRCHGENGSIEGGVNYVLDRNQMIARGKVSPNEPMKSRIIKRILLEEMPPDGEKVRPTAAELETLKAWIAGGALDFNPGLAKRTFISNDAVMEAVNLDLKKFTESDRRFTRYFSFAHLYNAKLSTDELTTYRQGLSKLINSLSWGKKIVPPVSIDTAQNILRIDLRDYKWSPKTWESLESHYPYAVLSGNANEIAIQSATETRTPILRGDWFVASAALPPLYHDLLNLPMTDRNLEKELRVNALDNLRDGDVMRAGFNSSGVSRSNRLIERHSSLFGAYWKSYDFASSTHRQNLFALPLGPGVRVTHFKHDGGEIIFSLPNGLQGYMLVDARGDRIDKGPTEIVSDPRRPDRSVVNGLSCMSCHSRGIITKDDQVRPHVEKNRQAFLKDELDQIFAQYPTRQRMQKAMAEDAERFREAVEKTGCRPGDTEPIAALTQRFESEVDLNHAAAELGIPAAQLQASFEKSITLGRFVGPLAIEGGTVQREVFTEAFANIVQDLGLGKVVAPSRRSHFAWTAPARPAGWTPPIGLVELPVKPKAVRKFAGTPGSRYEDPWYFHVSSHPTGQLHTVALSPKEKRVVAYEATTGVIALFHRGLSHNWTTMHGHEGNILSLDFSPNAELLASGSIDQTAVLWDADTGAPRHVLKGHTGFVRAVKFSPDGKWIATGSERIRLWNTATGSESIAFTPSPTWIDCLAFSPDGKTIASANKSVQLCDVGSGKLQHAFADHLGDAISLAFSPDGKLFAYGTSKGLIYLLERETNRTLAILKGHRYAVTALSFNHNSTLLISTSKPATAKGVGEFKAWDPATGKERTTQTGHKSGISALSLSTDSRVAVTVGHDGHIRFRDLMFLNKVPLEPFEGHSQTIHHSAFSADGSIAATCGSDQTVRIWNGKTGTAIHRLDGHSMPVHSVCIGEQAKFAFSGGADKTVRKWDLATGKLAEQWSFPNAIADMTISADRRTLAILAGRDFVRILNADTGKTIRDLQGPERAVALSPDGKRIAGAALNGGMRVWDVTSGSAMAAFGDTNVVLTSAAFSSDARHILTGARDHSVCLWDAATGKEIMRFKGCTKEVRSVAFSPDGKKILASCGELWTPGPNQRPEYAGAAVFMWDLNGNILHRWDTPALIVRHLAVAGAEPAALFTHTDGVKRVLLP